MDSDDHGFDPLVILLFGMCITATKVAMQAQQPPLNLYWQDPFAPASQQVSSGIQTGIRYLCGMHKCSRRILQRNF